MFYVWLMAYGILSLCCGVGIGVCLMKWVVKKDKEFVDRMNKRIDELHK